MVLRTFILAAAVLAVGCEAQKPGTSSRDKATAEPLAFRSPQDIRPANSSFEPKPMPPAPAVAPATPQKPKASGEWAPAAKPRAWKYIVIHHSASPSGNAAIFDREHRVENQWDELGYHFVIGNSQGAPDGLVEIGPRWKKQKWGAHAKTPDNRFNDFGIGVCFVGNFEKGRPTAKQMAAATKLVAWLMQTYDIPAKNVIGHEDTGKQTLCPGKYLSVARVRGLAEHALAQASAAEPVAIDDETPATAVIAAAPVDRELLETR